MKSQNKRNTRLFRVLIVMALLVTLMVPLSSSFAQGTPNQQDDGDDQFVSPGERFVTPQELSRIERDYREYGEDEQGQDECGQYWVVLNREYLGMVVINCDVPLNLLLDANPQITDPSVILPRQVIRIPETPNFNREILDPDTGRAYVTLPDEEQPGLPPTGGEPNLAFDLITDLDENEQGQDECGANLPVEPGWTLSTIIINCDVPYRSLTGANPEVDFDELILGESITIPEGNFQEIRDPFTGRAYVFPATAGVIGLPDTGGGDGDANVGNDVPGASGGFVRDELVFNRNGRLFIPDRSREQLEEIAQQRDYTLFDMNEQGRNECGDLWVILPGETLSTPIVNCDVPRDELLAVNTWIDRPNLVYPGEAILIPQGDFEEILDPFTDRPYTGETLSTDL